MDLFRIILVHRNQYTPKKEKQRTNVKILIVKCMNVNVFYESVIKYTKPERTPVNLFKII